MPEPGDAGELIGDAGPEFIEPPRDELPAADPADAAALAGGLTWSEQRVRALLAAKGEALHGLVAVNPESTEWRYTQADLSAIAPSLTRILNRYPATRAAAAGGDELAVGVGFLGYGMRSWAERRRDLAALAAYQQLAGDEPEPPAAAAPVDVHEAAAGAGEFPPPSEVPPISSPRRM